MLYNNKEQRVQTNADCLNCPYFDKCNKKCMGLGKRCFEYDKYTMTAIDTVTHLPINLHKLNKLREQERGE